MLKRILILIAALAICACAFSESLPTDTVPEYITCICGKGEYCTCFASIHTGDGDTLSYLFKAVNRILIDENYLDKHYASSNFGLDSCDAVKAFQAENGIEETGILNDETLTKLFGTEPGGATEELPYLWVPMHGGEKLHKISNCSGMMDACIVSVNNGLYLIEKGYTRFCRECFPEYYTVNE